MTESPILTAGWQPWARSNLRRNPFGELTQRERAELAVVDVKAITEFVNQPGRAFQMIGACGRGKTTRLLAIESMCADASYVYLPEDRPCPPIVEGDPLLIDEAQRLPWRARRQIFQHRLPVVLATHRNLSRVLARYGYQVQTERIGQSNTPELVCQVLNRRIEASRLGDGPVPRISIGEATRLSRRFGSDIRAVEGYLYEQVQNQVSEHGEVRFVD